MQKWQSCGLQWLQWNGSCIRLRLLRRAAWRLCWGMLPSCCRGGADKVSIPGMLSAMIPGCIPRGLCCGAPNTLQGFWSAGHPPQHGWTGLQAA